jgi:hypothetical protein
MSKDRDHGGFSGPDFGSQCGNNGEKRPNEAPASRYCDAPFSYAEIHPHGEVSLCCPQWSGNRFAGNVFTDTPEEIWNSIQAQQIRAGILDGTFSQCERDVCPRLVGNSLPLRKKDDVSTIRMARGPRYVKLCHDITCNLSCPSCRTEKLVANKEKQILLDRMLKDFILPFLSDCEDLGLSGDGDPFASRHYRGILRETANNPKLRISLHTNAVLCDKQAWDDCSLWGRVDRVRVSIDAAQAHTYATVRRGGDFNRLKENLAFLSSLRRSNEFSRFSLNFTVQPLNFREMADFVRLGEAFGADEILFTRMENWGRAQMGLNYSSSEIWREDHPLHPELLKVLADPVFESPIVDLGNVHSG